MPCARPWWTTVVVLQGRFVIVLVIFYFSGLSSWLRAMYIGITMKVNDESDDCDPRVYE